MMCDVSERMRSEVLNNVKKIQSDIVDASIPDSYIMYERGLLQGMMQIAAMSGAISLNEQIDIHCRIGDAVMEFRPNL